VMNHTTRVIRERGSSLLVRETRRELSTPFGGLVKVDPT
jgi:hypothetical protein